MLRLTIIFRRLLRNKNLISIHVISLTLGISGCLFLFTYCYYQFSYDRYHGDLNRLFRINSVWTSEIDEDPIAISNGSVSLDLKENYSFVEAAGYISLIGRDPVLRIGANTFETVETYYANQDILNVFNFEFINGLKSEALKGANKIVISQKYAKRFFDSIDCIGKIVSIEGNDHLVTGVFRNWPPNVDFNVNALISESKKLNATDQFAYFSYVKTTESRYEPELYHALDKLSSYYSSTASEFASHIRFRPQKLEGLHFENQLDGDFPKGNIQFVYLYLVTGIILFIIVITNQINLSFLRSSDLIKTNGLMRIFGCSRRSIQLNSVLESIAILIFSTLLALTLYQFLAYSNLEIGQFYFGYLSLYPEVSILILSVFFLSTFIIGYFSSFIALTKNPTNSIRKELSRKLPVARFRNYLVLFQFVVGMILVSSLIIIWKQYSFIQNKELGYNSESIYSIEFFPVDEKSSANLYHKLVSYFGSDNISTSGFNGGRDVSFSTLKIKDNDYQGNVAQMIIDPSFLDILSIPILKGQKFSNLRLPEYDMNENIHIPVLINESFSKKLEAPIGTNILLDGLWKMTVSGIIRDFHFQSLHQQVEPLVLNLQKPRFFPDLNKSLSLLIKSSENLKEVNSKVKLAVGQDQLFVSRPLSEKILANYSQEKIAINLLGIFCIASLFTACLGIIGIIQYSLERRKFELGIRKFLGARKKDLIYIFGSWSFRLIGFAFIISLPISIYVSNYYLSLYAYSTTVPQYFYLLPAAITAIITCLITYSLISKSTKVNVSELLREE